MNRQGEVDTCTEFLKGTVRSFSSPSCSIGANFEMDDREGEARACSKCEGAVVDYYCPMKLRFKMQWTL